MNKLQKLIGAGIISLGLFGSCSKDHSQYNFNGQIEDEFVKFESINGGIFWGENNLTIVDKEGKVKSYSDYFGDDLILEEFQIRENGKFMDYINQFRWAQEMKKAQKQFDDYLKKILSINLTEGNLEF